jgi:hypothetical protein
MPTTSLGAIQPLHAFRRVFEPQDGSPCVFGAGNIVIGDHIELSR